MGKWLGKEYDNLKSIPDIKDSNGNACLFNGLTIRGSAIGAIIMGGLGAFLYSRTRNVDQMNIGRTY